MNSFDMNKILLLLSLFFFQNTFSQDDSNLKTTIGDSKFSISASVGPSLKIGKRADNYPSNINNYINNDRLGCSYEVSVMYDINDKSSYGIKMENFEGGKKSNHQNIFFIGASHTSHFRTVNPLNSSQLSFAFGYMSFKNDIKELDKITVKGSTLGMNINYIYYYGVSNNFQLGPKISLMGGALTKVKINENGESSKYKFEDGFENLFYLNLSLSARYKF